MPSNATAEPWLKASSDRKKSQGNPGLGERKDSRSKQGVVARANSLGVERRERRHPSEAREAGAVSRYAFLRSGQDCAGRALETHTPGWVPRSCQVKNKPAGTDRYARRFADAHGSPRRLGVRGVVDGLVVALDALCMAKTMVILHVYRLLPEVVDAALRAMIGGVYHSGVEVGGVEYAYGGHSNATTGVWMQEPGVHPKGFVEVACVTVGASTVSPHMVRRLVLPLMRAWPGRAYNLVSRNCHHFSAALLEVVLRVDDGMRLIPQWVNQASRDLGGASSAGRRALLGAFGRPEGGVNHFSGPPTRRWGPCGGRPRTGKGHAQRVARDYEQWLRRGRRRVEPNAEAPTESPSGEVAEAFEGAEEPPGLGTEESPPARVEQTSVLHITSVAGDPRRQSQAPPVQLPSACLRGGPR